MLKASCSLLSLFILLISSGCDLQKQDERVRALEADIKQLKADVAELKQKPKAPEHHYELRKDGFRTWRFDPATGQTCLKLTSADDWKRKETQSESCDCTDMTQTYTEMPTNTEDERRAAVDFYHQWVKLACGR
ncbi:MAG: hypothetical protein WAQ52_16770 [Terriglobales bacterium]